MIASGIILAFEEYRVQLAGVPVVVRLRGTNEEVGWKMVCAPLPGYWLVGYGMGLMCGWVE